MDKVHSYEKLETAIGYQFLDHANLARALTHASKSKQNYERLEFLGDRVLGLIVAEWLSELHPDAEEGMLAKSLAMLVARDSLAQVARRIGLGAELKFSSGDSNARMRDNANNLADSCEAVIAAIYLDGGLEPAKTFIRSFWQPMLEEPPDSGDSKTRLQEWSQARQLGLPVYREIARSGSDHAPSFTIAVEVAGHPPQTGMASSKRLAERAAAAAMLAALADQLDNLPLPDGRGRRAKQDG